MSIFRILLDASSRAFDASLLIAAMDALASFGFAGLVFNSLAISLIEIAVYEDSANQGIAFWEYCRQKE